MITALDLKQGMALRIEGQIYKVLNVEAKAGTAKLGGVVKTKLRNVSSGCMWEPHFRPQERLEDLQLERRMMEFLFADADSCTFMNPETFEQVEISRVMLGSGAQRLESGMQLPFCERRVNRLLNPHLSMGLPAFLTTGAGMFSGLMLSQYTAGALVCENHALSHPAATGSIPAAADQEDFVSMGMTTAIKTRQIIENAWYVAAIELLTAAQAFDLRAPVRPSPASQAVYETIRSHVAKLEEDRPLYADINTLARVSNEGDILESAEKIAGRLN